MPLPFGDLIINPLLRAKRKKFKNLMIPVEKIPFGNWSRFVGFNFHNFQSYNSHISRSSFHIRADRCHLPVLHRSLEYGLQTSTRPGRWAVGFSPWSIAFRVRVVNNNLSHRKLRYDSRTCDLPDLHDQLSGFYSSDDGECDLVLTTKNPSS